MNKVKKNNKGITLISLAVTIIVMTVLTASLTISVKSTTQIENYYEIKEDIIQLSENVQDYYMDNGELPITNGATAIAFNIDNKYKNPNDDDVYYRIDTSKFKDLTINNSKVHYILNRRTLTVYCQEGYVMDGKKRYTIVDGLEFYNKVDCQIIPVVSFESNNSNGKYIANPGDTVTLKMRRTEQFTTQPVITINGQTVTATWNNNVGTALYKIPDDDENFDQLINFSISGYSADGKNGEEITKPTFKEGVTLKEPLTPCTFPYYPTGCSKIAGTELKNGLVMQDSNGNQYVWVEVPKLKTVVYKTAGKHITSFTSDECTKIENDLFTYTSIYRKTGYTDTFYSTAQAGLTSSAYSSLKQQALKSIYTYGGFWIGRYEVGDSTATANNKTRNSTSGITDTAVIMEDQEPYNYISCSQAESIAQTFNPDRSKYNTSIPFGLQWDLMNKFLETKGTLVEDLNKNSSSCGNYSDSNFEITKGKYKTMNTSESILTTWNTVNGKYTKKSDESMILTTGATKRNCKFQIYDLAGNLEEWTLEYTNDTALPCSKRGGSFIYYGVNCENFRLNGYADYSEEDYGARVALYTK